MFPDLSQNESIDFAGEDVHIDGFAFREKFLILEHENPIFGADGQVPGK